MHLAAREQGGESRIDAAVIAADEESFLRPNAPLHFVVVSHDESWMSAEDFRSQMRTQTGKEFIFHAIVSEDADLGPEDLDLYRRLEHGLRPAAERRHRIGPGPLALAQAEPLAVARSLTEQLIEALPEAALWAARRVDANGTVFEFAAGTGAADDMPHARLRLRAISTAAAARVAQQQALVHWLLLVAARHTLCIVVDDVDRVDEPSAALLAALVLSVAHKRMLLVASCEPTAPSSDSALGLLARECRTLALRPLVRHETEALLGSLFGDVPNLALLSERIYASAGGRPRESMALAQHMVETNAITYAGGSRSRSSLAAGLEPRDPTRANRAGAAMTRPTTIYLVRHAESRPSADVREPDWPLSERGREQARTLVAAMQGLGIDAIYSSPYPRAAHTLAPLAAALGKPLGIVDALRERVLTRRNLGGDEYWPTIERYWGDWDFALPDGESNRACARRMVQAIDALAARHPGETIALASHGNALAIYLGSLDPSFG